MPNPVGSCRQAGRRRGGRQGRGRQGRQAGEAGAKAGEAGRQEVPQNSSVFRDKSRHH